MLCFHVHNARAEFLIAVDVAISLATNNEYEYRYTVTNEVNSSASLAAFGIEKPIGVGGTSNEMPSLWVADIDTLQDVMGWEAIPDVNALIQPGTTSTFVLSSAFPPRPQEFVLIGADTASSHLVTATGQVDGPGFLPGDYDADLKVGGRDFLI